ncbi:MAG: 3-deoxy-8-phosphooctulonate synthase [Saprospiraceae bacterium]|nr:3-deoxy-8-phosphooctulonate synthase [Saprospiraceae bacterium]
MKENILKQIQDRNHPHFFLIAGPCVVESEQLCQDIAGHVKEICDRLQIPYIFKASYRKANRSKIDSFTGIGDRLGMEILHRIGSSLNIPVTTDIHTEDEAGVAAQYTDVLQIPAFLCRQTSLLQAAAATGKTVNVKKGQFMSPEGMQFAVDKIRQSGNSKVWLTDRGTTFGYQDLIVDYRGIPAMRAFEVPVIMDCTHSLQQPNQTSGVTGGKPQLIETIAKAAVAVGADGLFIETHPNPAVAKSDGANMLKMEYLEALLEKLLKIRQALN